MRRREPIVNATATLPIEGAGVVDCCRAKIRAMLAPYIAPARRVDAGEALWVVLTDSERRFICRAAKVDADLAAYSWRDLPEPVRADVVGAWYRLAEWVGRVQLHLETVARRRS